MLSGEGLRQEAEFLAALDGLGATDGSELLEGARTVRLDGIFGNEKLRGDIAIAEAAGDQGKNLELARRYATGLLVDRIGNERFDGRGPSPDERFSRRDFAGGSAPARDSQPKPDAEGREEDGDQRAVEFYGVLDDDETVFGVLEGGDEEPADETEDENVALHDGGSISPYAPGSAHASTNKYCVRHS